LVAWQQVAGEGWFVLNRRWIGNCGFSAAVSLSTCSSDFLIGHDCIGRLRGASAVRPNWKLRSRLHVRVDRLKRVNYGNQVLRS